MAPQALYRATTPGGFPWELEWESQQRIWFTEVAYQNLLKEPEEETESNTEEPESPTEAAQSVSRAIFFGALAARDDSPSMSNGIVHPYSTEDGRRAQISSLEASEIDQNLPDIRHMSLYVTLPAPATNIWLTEKVR